MFERLINSFGQPANQQENAALLDAELQLAAAILLFGTLPVDHDIAADETAALQHSLQQLLRLSPDKTHRLIARAAAAVAKDSSIMASATLLKHRTSVAFRLDVMHAVKTVICADGRLHDNEIERHQRIARLLGLPAQDLQLSA